MESNSSECFVKNKKQKTNNDFFICQTISQKQSDLKEELILI